MGQGWSICRSELRAEDRASPVTPGTARHPEEFQPRRMGPILGWLHVVDESIVRRPIFLCFQAVDASTFIVLRSACRSWWRRSRRTAPVAHPTAQDEEPGVRQCAERQRKIGTNYAAVSASPFLSRECL